MKPHIGIFGRRNSGKSSLINTLTGQEIAIVSEVAGTTTDPVKKSLEIPDIGPAVLIDTAGIDDAGDLGEKRIAKSMEALRLIDLAILIIDQNLFGDDEKDLIAEFRSNDIPFFIIHNKEDLTPSDPELRRVIGETYSVPVIPFSMKHPVNQEEITNAIRSQLPETAYSRQSLLGDIISPGDVVLLITPIDLEAPEGRMILPQVQVIRDVLDHDGILVVCKENEVAEFIRKMEPKPVIAITDSQVFPKADLAVPKEIMLTSFSILLAHHKGDFENYLKATPKLKDLKNGDRVLILESCSHHVTCDDIGRVKLPKWLRGFTGKELEFDVVAGLNRIERPMTDYAIVIQCGGCMITRKQILHRLRPAIMAGVPVTNYGLTIAFINGIFDRAIEPFRVTP